jgi:hypothetical protein
MGPLPRPFVRAFLAFTVIVLTAPLHGDAQSSAIPIQDVLLGTWRLDLSKSRYSPGPPPRSETRLYARDDKGVVGRIDRVYADGTREVIDYRADANHDVPVSGTRAYDAVRFRRIDEYTTEGVLSHAGHVYGYSRRIISPDGQTLTITFRREERGDMVNNYAVYIKERK